MVEVVKREVARAREEVEKVVEMAMEAVVRCGLVANAVYVAVRGNGADPLNLVEVQAKGKVATVQAESDGNGDGGRRSLSPSQSHLRAHSQQGEAGATADHQQEQREQREQ